MRALTLFAAALALSACGKGAQTDNTQNVESFTPESITSNDVTAIDAVTGEAANMAADVPLDTNTTEEMGASENSAGNVVSSARRTGPRTAPAAVRPKTGPKSPVNPSEPAANSATNSL